MRPRTRVTRARDRRQPWLEALEDRTAPAGLGGEDQSEQEGNDTPATANALTAQGVLRGAIGVGGDRDWFVVKGVSGRLQALVEPAEASALMPRLRLVGADGREIVRSDAGASRTASI